MLAPPCFGTAARARNPGHAPFVASGTVPVDTVAAHAFEAAAAGRVEEAVAWAERAPAEALGRLGYEDAVRLR
jgi:hypothetical protein